MNASTYDSYRESGIEWLGQVPSHWSLAKLRYLADFVGGGTPSRNKPEFWGGDVPWVSPKDMKTELILGAQENITEEGLAGSSSSLIEPGAVLMVVRSGILQHTIPVAQNAVPVALNQDMKALRFNEECSPAFFVRWVQGLNNQLLLAWAKQTYYETAELESATDPNAIFDLRAKLDGAGHYDDFDVERVVTVELNPKAKQAELIAALEPVADRLLKAFNGAKQARATALATGNAQVATDALDHMAALDLFKGDMGAFLRLYSFLSQIIDYGNTDLEKRAIFYRRLLPLLAFGREREGVDLSGVQLTHHSLKSQGKRDLTFGTGEAPKLTGMAEVGSGGIHEKEKALLDEIIERVNGLFDGELSDEDQLAYVTGFLRSHMAASDELRVQAANNTSAQFANSPTLRRELMDAAMDSDAAFNTMSRQVLNSETVREELLKILLGPGQLYEWLRGEVDR